MFNRVINIFIALAFIVFGIFLILENFNLLDVSSSDYFGYLIPLFFIVIGASLIINRIVNKRSSWMFGSFLLIFGTLLLLGRLPNVDFEFKFKDIFKLWPLLIIYIGYLIGFGNRRTRKRVKMYIGGNKNYMNRQDFSIGTENFDQPNWEVKPLTINNAVGEHYFDFTKAFIPDEEIPITINSWAGDIRMIIPKNLEFRVEAFVKAGEINILGQSVDGINRQKFYESPNYKTATKKLDIYLDLKAGSIRIDQI